jgi:hypothetical protein
LTVERRLPDTRLVRSLRAALAASALAGAAWVGGAPAASAGGGLEDRLQRRLDGLVRAEGGPPGAVVTLRRGAPAGALLRRLRAMQEAAVCALLSPAGTTTRRNHG